jgi:hypothetical protein
MATTITELEKTEAAESLDRAWYGLGLHGSEHITARGLDVDAYLSKLARLAAEEAVPS